MQQALKQQKNKRRWRRVFLGAALVAAVTLTGAALLPHSAKVHQPVAPLSGPAQEMRKSPVRWFKQERDISALVNDLRTSNVVAAGLADDAVMVATKTGANYFVADTRFGRVGDLVLSAYKNEKMEAFPVVFLDGVKHTPPPEAPWALVALDVAGRTVSLVFLVSLVAGLVMLVRQAREGTFKLSKSMDVKFSDVIGAAEAKSAVQDIVAYLKDPQAFTELGGRPPHGVLMVGPPGTGKTRLAQALAGECGVSFIAVNGSDFSSKYYGVAIQRVKALFQLARKHAPCIVLIDEIDGVGKRTTSSDNPAAAESNRIINQMLVEMNGFSPKEGVIVIGATNLVDMLDEAMLRPGRFDRQVHVRLPELKDRQKIFELYAKDIKTAADVDYAQLARLTTGLSPAAIEAMVNQAALLAAKEQATAVALTHFLEAVEIARMGEANTGAQPLSPEDRWRVAVHEAGHAFIAQKLGAGRVEKVTILPRGGALGVTLVTHEEDRHLLPQSELEKRITMLLGGRCAELLLLGEASTGAAEDLREASRLALAMVAQFGLGQEGRLFSLNAIPNPTLAQGEMTRAVAQAEGILQKLERRCLESLDESKEALAAFAQRLLEAETLPGYAVQEELEAAPLKRAA